VAATKLIRLEDATGLVRDGAKLAVGGVLLRRKPIAFLSALADAGRGGLGLYTFLASLDVDLLVARGAVAEVHAGYVGFEQLGFAPAFGRAVAAGEVRAFEYSELVFVSGLRASLAGLPFLPTRGARGSDLVAELGLQEVVCPYTGESLIAAPAIRPDVCVIHAEAADERGNVIAPSTRDFLFDADATLARASATVIVTAERIVPTSEIRDGGALLFSYEVDAVVELPSGAWPTALPGVYGTDVEAVRTYLAAAETDAEGAAVRLVGGRA
jgi:glutaconate CoA-transferase, subunit A